MFKPFAFAALCGLLLMPVARAQDGAMSDDSMSNATTAEATGNVNLRAFLSGTDLPLSLQMSDLDSKYRSFTIARSNDTFLDYMRMVGAMQGLEFGRYYTTGQTTNIGGQTYLICYRPQTPLDPAALRNFGHGDPVVPTKPSPDDKLSLSLIDLKTAGSLNDVRVFDPKRELQTDADGRAASVRTLTFLGQGMRQAIRARGGVVPAVAQTVDAQTRRNFYPYVHDERTWKNPANDEFYTPNPEISGLRLSNVRNAKYVPAFYESEPASDGSVAIVFLDGHVERATAARWQRYQEVEPIVKPSVVSAYVANMTPRIKTALGANAAMRGSIINVDTIADSRTIILRGTVTTGAQRQLATAIAKRNSGGFRVINGLNVKR